MPKLQRLVPYLSAFLSGMLLLLAMPGSGGLWWLSCFALIPLFYTAVQLSGKGLALAALSGGLVHYSLQMYWLVNVLKQYGGLPIVLALAALVLLAVYMSLYLVVFVFVARLFWSTGWVAYILWGLPLFWVALDWLRSWLFTGLPWMDLGYALAAVPKAIQLADITGHYGITFLLVQLNIFFFFCLQYLFGKANKWAWGKFVAAVLPLFCFVIVVILYSNFRYQEMTGKLADNRLKQLNIGIVQGNIDQNSKWDDKLQRYSINKYLKLTKLLFANDSPEVVVWPETALPFYPARSAYTESLKSTVSHYEFSLITGAPWFEITDREKGQINYYNSSVLFTPDGRYKAFYYKSHLVPFGEYVPFKEFFSFMTPLVEGAGDFTAGTVGNPPGSEEARAGVLICFESIFPDIARRWVVNGANYLVNLTNDAWYGLSSAPHHSLAMTVFRAVETRRNLVRSANTGISGVIDARGELLDCSPLFKAWAIARKIALLEGSTIYVRFGYLFAPFSFFLSGVLIIFLLWRRKTDSSN